ncbi:CobW family GTP-binding protein [Alistipes sp. ZOR0009]|uniref:CobW family GTP-binding protein n=1 Tax=Alistipes sp. ZOR0009 TaxID=1339253 RepID=UPI0006456469|nr:GTP-binding protein [Alistipes sp. ZOR0009]
MEKIPVTIITGFLGSGKTTLLNNLIRKYATTRFAIIENEFGDINIDADLVVGPDKGSVFELSNGCICCSMNDELYKTLEELLRMRDKFSHLIIETTGIADPLTVIQSFIGDPSIADRFDIDAVVCLIDAPIFEELLEEQEEVSRQLVMADVVLINKIDSITPGYLDAVKMVVARANPSAEVYATSFSGINGIDLIGINAYTGRQVASSTRKFDNVLPLRGLTKMGGFTAAIASKALMHNIQSNSFVFKGDFDFEKFSLWMESFFYFSSSRVFRVKGILSFAGKGRKVIFHSVRGAFMLEEADEWRDEEERESRLVFIGKGINKNEIEQALTMLLVK